MPDNAIASLTNINSQTADLYWQNNVTDASWGTDKEGNKGLRYTYSYGAPGAVEEGDFNELYNPVNTVSGFIKTSGLFGGEGAALQNLAGSTITTKSTADYTLVNSGYGDELKASVYTGTVVGEAGSVTTSDASTSNGKPEGTSVTVGGVLTLGYGYDKSVSIGVGAFGYEGHVGIGIGNGLGQVSAGGSHTANGVISGGDLTFKAGGVTATAVVAAAIIATGGFGALAL
jgi:hypothetical protein